MKCRNYLWFCLVVVIHFFSWYFALCFCAIYGNSAISWLQGLLMTILLDIFVKEVLFIFMKVTSWKLAQLFPNK